MNALLTPQHRFMYTIQNDIAVYPIKILDFDFEEEAESLTYDVLFSEEEMDWRKKQEQERELQKGK